MKTITQTALRKAILAAEAEGLKHPLAFRPDRTQRAGLQKGRRESEAILSMLLKGAGLDLKKLQALHDKRDAQLQRMVAGHKAAAVRRVAKQKDVLQLSITVRTQKLLHLPHREESLPYRIFYLTRPFLIWSTPLQEMSDNAADQNRNYTWAKFKFATSQSSGPQKYGFYFYWVNSSSEYAVIKAETALYAEGYLTAHAPWPWGFGVNTSSVEAFACLNLWSGWPDDVTSVQYGRESLGGTRALSYTLLGGDTHGTSISAPYVRLNAPAFPVPPGKGVVFEVSLLLEYKNDSGNIEADFETGAFQILCPKLNVSVLNSPPGLVNAVML